MVPEAGDTDLDKLILHIRNVRAQTLKYQRYYSSICDDLAISNAFRDAASSLAYVEGLAEHNRTLTKALTQIIAQWDTPNWKMTEMTADIIAKGREALASELTILLSIGTSADLPDASWD